MKAIRFSLLMAAAIALAACTGGGVKGQKQIATACASITAGVSAIAAGVETGKVSKADGQKALIIARPTAGFCQPKPAAYLSPVDYASLLAAAADIATLKSEKLP